MRYTEIIQDWISIGDQDFKMPTFSGNIIGTIKTTGGDWEIDKLILGNDIQYSVLDQNGTDVIAFIALNHFKANYYMTKNAGTLKSKQGNGLLSALMNYVGTKEGLKLLSDTHMSPTGIKLWHSIDRKPGLNTKIYNMNTGETFDKNDVGKVQATDGSTVIHPKDDDNLEHQTWPNIRKNEQRYVYVLEARGHVKQPKGSLIQEIVWYGPGIDQP